MLEAVKPLGDGVALVAAAVLGQDRFDGQLLRDRAEVLRDHRVAHAAGFLGQVHFDLALGLALVQARGCPRRSRLTARLPRIGRHLWRVTHACVTGCSERDPWPSFRPLSESEHLRHLRDTLQHVYAVYRRLANRYTHPYRVRGGPKVSFRTSRYTPDTSICNVYR